MPPESNWTAHHEDPSPQRHQPSSWALQSAKGQEKLLGEHTPAPPRLCSGKRCKPFSHPAPLSQSGKAGLGCPSLPEPCCFAGGLRSLNPTPYVFFFTGKQDGMCIGFLRPCPSNTALEKLGQSAPRPQLPKGTNRVPGPCSPPRLCSGKQCKPFSHPAPRSQSGKAGLGCLWLPEPCCFAGGLRSLNPTPHVFSFTGKQDGTCITLHQGPNTPKAPTEFLGPAVCKGTGNIPHGAIPAPPRLCSRK